MLFLSQFGSYDNNKKMNRISKSNLLGALCLLMGLSAWAQKRSLNEGWDFVRLTQAAAKWEIKNQGSDWHSQFNVEHVQAATRQLAVPADTLKQEMAHCAAAKWERVSLPHTAFTEDLVILHPWQGICYYRKNIRVSAEEAAQHCWIEFEGAMHLADVWINGKHVVQHAGGYTPFLIDATGLLKPDADNEMLVRLDNRNNPLIPPGKPLENLDFCYHSGIYRDVNLIVKPDVHITNPLLTGSASGGILVTYPTVSEQQAVVEVRTELKNASAQTRTLTLRQTLWEYARGKKGKKAAQTTQTLQLPAGTGSLKTQQLHVASPRLWHPETPNLYVLQTEISDGKRLVDAQETRIGIRRFELSREKGFVINGKPLRLVGSNRHMEYPYVGNAISDQAQYRDMWQIRNGGFNIVRLGHYPQDPSVLEACDELGLLVIEPIPGWQFYNKNETFRELTFQSIREMIRRDRNHTSVLMWETTLNESWPPNEWKDKAVAVAHQEMPGCIASGDMYGYHGFDVSYNDWNDAAFSRPNDGPKPGFIREYYDYEFGGHYSTTRINRGNGLAALLQNAWNAQWSHNRNRTYYPWTMGDAVWSMYDYNRGCCDNICYSGVADVFRLPKFSYTFFRTQLSHGQYTPGGPMPYEVFAATYWEQTPSDTVRVFANVEEVELRVNGKTVKRQRPDNGPNTPYVRKPDGGNCKELNHPPFTFTGIAWETGTLEAIGYQNGKEVARHRVKTPAQPHHLDITYFESGRPAAVNDLLIVHVSLHDAAHTLCPINGTPVSLSVEGGEVAGPASYDTEAGIASFLVRTGTAKKLSLTASSGQLKATKNLKLVR